MLFLSSDFLKIGVIKINKTALWERGKSTWKQAKMARVFTAHWNHLTFLPQVKEISNNCFSLSSFQHFLHLCSQENHNPFSLLDLMPNYRSCCWRASQIQYLQQRQRRWLLYVPPLQHHPWPQSEAKVHCFSFYAKLKSRSPPRHTALSSSGTRV